MVARLFQIVYLLMERDSMTAKELADKLEVSVRTINRDIEKLSEARIPIYATRGRGGGISLLPDFVLNKKVLTEEEKSSILSSMKVLGTVAYDDEKQALNRLEDFFGEVAQDWIEIELDTWNEGNFDQDRFRQLKGAILSHKKLSFDYMKKGIPEFRTIRPFKLVFRARSGRCSSRAFIISFSPGFSRSCLAGRSGSSTTSRRKEARHGCIGCKGYLQNL